ncbi:transmembrane protein 164 [Culicoides brevitarsis]|uniref:transmembrane protein 164 n=1 Tax=Culicoides brevitarsis TaxID=469753 RepID=UPI00307B1DA0
MHFDWAIDGVNTTVPRNAGPECRMYLTPTRIVIECIVVIICSILAIRYSWSNIIKKKSLPDYNLVVTSRRATNDLVKLYHQQTTTSTQTTSSGETITTNHTTINHYYEKVPVGQQILLVVMTLTLGIELGFKFASRSVIYILNPCHIITMLQIYILAARPSKTITILFRIQMNYLNGPFLAFVFPETATRQFALEWLIYWIQHALMWIIPGYLLQVGGVYSMEPLMDFDWNILGYAILMIYHFFFLQVFAVPTQVNLNHMLCPAILDPFDGQNYRIAAIIHQGILCPLLCKIMCILFMPRDKPDHTTNNNHHQLEQSAHATSMATSKSNKNATANGNHKNLVNSVESDAITCSLSKDVKVD